MSCFKGGATGQSIQQVEKLLPEQEALLRMLIGQVTPAIGQIPQTATIPGMEFAPTGPSGLQQQAFGLAGQLPGAMAFDPSQITSAMAPVGQYAQQMFQQEGIPAIMGALGAQGMARSSGAANILGREGRNLSMGLGAQFAPMQYQGLQSSLDRQAQMPGILAGIGGLQQSFPEAQRQFGLDRFMAGAPESSPLLGLLGPALGTSAYDTAVQQGFYQPSWFETMAGMGGQAMGAYAAGSDERIKEDIESIENALEKVKQIDGKVFKFIFKKDERDGGVIAQDLEKVLPEAVIEREGLKYVKYEAVIGLLVNAVKELARKVG